MKRVIQNSAINSYPEFHVSLHEDLEMETGLLVTPILLVTRVILQWQNVRLKVHCWVRLNLWNWKYNVLHLSWDYIWSRDQNIMGFCAWWPNIISLVEFGSHEPWINGDTTLFILHVTIVSCGHCGWWLLLKRHQPVNFSGHRPRGSGNITFFICHKTSRDHVFQGTCKFLFCSFLSTTTILSSLMATYLVELEI